MPRMIKVTNCSIGYSPKSIVIKQVTFDFGLKLNIIDGPNGSGKSTLLRALSGILKPSNGTVTIDGKDPYRDPDVRANIGYLPHRLGGQSSLRVRDYLQFWYELRREKRNNREIEQIKIDFGLSELNDKKMEILSRGQLQRVALLKTFSSPSDLLILDEPFTGLDTHYTQLLVQTIISRVNNGTTIVASMHGAHPLRENTHVPLNLSGHRSES
jgi:ABC-type multidrug transport system ATPase subunit